MVILPSLEPDELMNLYVMVLLNNQATPGSSGDGRDSSLVRPNQLAAWEAYFAS
jgi:hypothetical protein